MDIADLYNWIVSLPDKLDTKSQRIAAEILKEIRTRLQIFA